MEKNCEEYKGTQEKKLGFYVIEYFYGKEAKGLAMVKANNPKEASDIFKSNSNFNGAQYKLKITLIEPIYEGPAPALLAETYTFL